MKKINADLLAAEENIKGDIGFKDFKDYFKYCGGVISIGYLLGISIINAGL
jgi:hypothetical protein